MTEGRNDGMTEGRKDGMTEGRKGATLYAPAIKWGHKNYGIMNMNSFRVDIIIEIYVWKWKYPVFSNIISRK